MATSEKIEIGTRIYNNGDVCNRSHWATVISIEPCKWYDLKITLKADDEDGETGRTYTINPYAISPEYKGHGGTRFVTKTAYDAWKAEQVAKFYERFPHLKITINTFTECNA